MSQVFALLISIALCLTGCSSGRSDPLAPGGGSLSPGADRANLAVTQSNQYEALQQFFEQIYDSYIKAINLTADAGELVRVMGNHNGYAIAGRINPDSAGTGTDEIRDVQLEYTSYYSDTGTLFAKGTLELRGLWSNIDGNFRLNTFFLDGTLEFSGNFACTVQFIGFRMALDGNGKAIDLPKAVRGGATNTLPSFGLVIITSEGVEQIRFNPYEFDFGPPGDLTAL